MIERRWLLVFVIIAQYKWTIDLPDSCSALCMCWWLGDVCSTCFAGSLVRKAPPTCRVNASNLTKRCSDQPSSQPSLFMGEAVNFQLKLIVLGLCFWLPWVRRVASYVMRWVLVLGVPCRSGRASRPITPYAAHPYESNQNDFRCIFLLCRMHDMLMCWIVSFGWITLVLNWERLGCSWDWVCKQTQFWV